ncbi:restriction endonuclease [Streptomyces sp. MNU76]|uniref:restriction endonuclease n=1 Tax=Streptomyces sp. MNU76 TaxID=2560026 RepID=UPI001E4F8059|nr:restriction endonuclease [Streptomyces sp. MNU76]MCC9705514.1 restriction endonuclease [Streptomyces sp. MNU76]
MIIDRTARVVPPRYPDRDVRSRIGDALGKADDADLLAAYLWVQEVSIGREACTALRRQRDALRKNLEKLNSLKNSSHFRGRTWDFTRAELDSLFDAFIMKVSDELDLIDGSLRQAGLAFEKLSTLPEEDLSTRYAPGRVDSPLNTIAEQWDKIAPSTERFAAMNDRALAEIERLAVVDDRRNIFAQSQKSYTLRRIREFDGKDFEVLVAWLTQRDGMKVIRQHGGTGDRGADVISQTPDGRRVVVQCKQTSRAAKQTVTSTNVQTFNGTARLEHKADIALMVTNGTFSEPARDFANDHAIHLIGATELERWATWGDSLYDVVGLSRGSALEASA